MTPVERKVILDVGGGTGEWSRWYRLHGGYDVRVIDPLTWPFATAEAVAFRRNDWRVHGLLLAPPCTEFAGSGARWWEGKDPALLERAVETVRAFLRLVETMSPVWWALENPVGRLAKEVPELGRHRYTWQPWHFGDAETKLTCMWGEHVQPMRTVLEKPADVRARVHLEAPGPWRQVRRSATPQGFARAFFEANP